MQTRKDRLEKPDDKSINGQDADRTGLTHRRWLILAAACFINLCIGSMYAWSVLAGPMAEELNADSLSIVFSLANSVGFISMIAGGILNDKYGPRWIVFGGGLMFGLGMYFSGMVQSVGGLILSYGIVVGLGMSFIYGCTISNTIKFFPDHRGLVGGMTTASCGISSVIFSNVGNWLNNSVGVRDSFRVLGAVFTVVICVCSFLLAKCPEGFLPTGFTPVTKPGMAKRDLAPGEVLKTPMFYVLFGMLISGGTFGMMVISSASSLAQDILSLPVASATLYVTLLCLFNTFGRLAAGYISDRIGRIATIMGALILAVTALVLLCLAEHSGSTACFAIGILLIGVCFGTFMGVFPGFSTDCFGAKYNTVNYGLLWIGFAAASIMGPILLSSFHLRAGKYSPAFVFAIGLAVVGFSLTFVYRRLRKKY